MSRHDEVTWRANLDRSPASWTQPSRARRPAKRSHRLTLCTLGFAVACFIVHLL